MFEMSGSGSGEFSGVARYTSGFGKSTALPVLSQTKTPILNQTTQPKTRLFGSTAAAPVLSQGSQNPTTHSILEGLNAGRTPTTTPVSTGGLFSQQNTSTKRNIGGGFCSSCKSNTPSQQSKSIGTSLAQQSINKFNAPQTSTAGIGTFDISATGAARNTSEFGQFKFDKPIALPVLSQTKTPLLNQTTQPKTGLFGSTSVAPVFGQGGQTPVTHPTKRKGFDANVTRPLFETSTPTSAFFGGLLTQKNASTVKNTGGGIVASSNSNISFRQTEPVKIHLAHSIFGASQTFAAGTGVFSTSSTGSGSGVFSGTAKNMSGFGQLKSGKLSATPVLSQTKTPLLNQTTQPKTELFGSNSAATVVFGQGDQTPTAHPKLEDLDASETCSLVGTPTTSSASTGGLFSQQNAAMKENTGGGSFSFIKPNTLFQESKPVEISFAQPSSNEFDAPQTSTAGTEIFDTSATGTFGATSGFGATSVGGTTIQFNPKYSPVTGTETYEKNDIIHTIDIRYHAITVMKEYETKDFEELRFDNYFTSCIVRQQGTVNGGFFEFPKSLFNSSTAISMNFLGANNNKPVIGVTATTPVLGEVMMKIQLFATPQTIVFGSTAPMIFGTQTTGFGQLNQNNLLYQNNPAFGFGPTQIMGFGFETNTSTNSHALFGSKPNNIGFQMTTSAFGANNTFEDTSTAQSDEFENAAEPNPGGKRKKT